MPKEFEKALLKSAITVRNQVINNLTGQRAGRLYKVPATMRVYRASKPFEFPATRLGHLRNSYKYIVKGRGMRAKAFVGSDLDYSHYLEYGTYKMKPRPHLKQAFKVSRKKIYSHFRGLL
jgi:HK97 gp10 family phage protein